MSNPYFLFTAAAAVFGILILGGCLFFLWKADNLTPAVLRMVRIIASFGAGFLGAGMGGGIEVIFDLPEFSGSGTGAAAFFLIVYFKNPAEWRSIEKKR